MADATKQVSWESVSVPIEELSLWEANTRTHSRDQIDALVGSITRFGVVVPLLVDEENRILAGNGTFLACVEAGLQEVPVRRVSGWDDIRKRKYVIADNRLAEMSEWSSDLLAALLRDLIETDLAGSLGYSDDELDAFLDDAASFAAGGELSASGTKPLLGFVGDSRVPIEQNQLDELIAVYHSYVAENGSHEGFVKMLIDGREMLSAKEAEVSEKASK